MIGIFTGPENVPLENAYVSFELIEGDGNDLPFGLTDSNGSPKFSTAIPPPTSGIEIFVTASGHGTLVIPHSQPTYEIVLRPVQVSPDCLGRWHRRWGGTTPSQLDGQGIGLVILRSSRTAGNAKPMLDRRNECGLHPRVGFPSPGADVIFAESLDHFIQKIPSRNPP